MDDKLLQNQLKVYTTRDKRNDTYILYSSTNSLYTTLRKKWYSKINDKTIKTVPRDLELTPTTLLFWYLGDGSLPKRKKDENRVPSIVLATNNFLKEDIKFLIQKLKELGLNFYPVEYGSGYSKGKKCGYALYSKTQDGTPFRFFRIIGLECPKEISNCITGRKGRGSKLHYFKDKWPNEEDWLRILSNVQFIGEMIKEKRMEKGLTQKALARYVGVKSRHIRHIEFGDRYPSVKIFRRILSVLGISSFHLLEKALEENA